MRKTKIICTIGPNTENPIMLQKLIHAGMDIARLNFSHGTYRSFSKTIHTIRALNMRLNKNVTILQDLQGFKIRLGILNGNYFAKQNHTLILNDSIEQQTHDEIPVNYPMLHRCIKPGEKIYIADGQIELMVLDIKGSKIITKVHKEGIISSHKGVNLPHTELVNPALTGKDKADALFGLKKNVDFVALSFVKDANDIKELRNFLEAHHGEKKIIAKIERKTAIEHIHEIINEADGIMVARGDMGIEIEPERVPIIQKMIIHLCNQAGKPVITATQMLTSMIEKPTPTRAEVSDISNSILDKTDAIMLSDETTIGKYPVEAVKVMHRTATRIEKYITCEMHPASHKQKHIVSPIALGDDVIKIACDVGAKHIVCFTRSGFTAIQIVKHRPSIPVLVFTTSEQTKKELSLLWGVTTIFVVKSFDNKLKLAVQLLKKGNFINTGDTIVFVSAGKMIKEGSMDELMIMKYAEKGR